MVQLYLEELTAWLVWLCDPGRGSKDALSGWPPSTARIYCPDSPRVTRWRAAIVAATACDPCACWRTSSAEARRHTDSAIIWSITVGRPRDAFPASSASQSPATLIFKEIRFAIRV